MGQTPKEYVRNEVIRCGRDPVYFIRKYARIRHPVRGLIPFDMFDYQERLVGDYVKHRFNVILKARQLGISEVTAAFAMWMMLFHRDKNILVMATKQSTAMNIIRKVQTAIKNLPEWLLLAEITTDNKLSIELSNGSVIKAIASSDDAGRSEALSLLIIDEAAFVKNLDELWTGLLPTVQAGGRVIVLSTPNGVGNKFHQLYTEAEDGTNDFHPTRLMWWLHPERVVDLQDDPRRPGFKTSTWYKNEIKSANMGLREIAQELECNFNASGETVVSADTLEWLSTGCYEPASKEHVDRGLHIWMEPQDRHRYFISADVARGDGKDYSAFHVWDITDMTSQAAEYYGKLPPDQFARLLCETGRRYRDAMLVVENNTIGLAALEHIQLQTYPNVYYSRKGDQKPGEAVHTFHGPLSDDLVAGFTTSSRVRPLMIAKLEEYLRNRTILFRSSRFLQELRTFVWKEGRPEAMRGYNDDLVMSAAIGVWIRDTFLAPSLMSAEMQGAMVSAISTSKRVHTDIPGAAKDPRFVNQRNMGSFGPKADPYKLAMPDGQVVDIGWLLPVTRG